MRYMKQGLGSGSITTSGLTLAVPPFQVGSFSFNGGSISTLPNGTWYVGVEMWSGQLRLLPRLGHRGWIPVAKIVTTSVITSLVWIDPVMPPTRIPRTLAKVLSGQPIKAIVMGSSLTEGSGNTNWAGMVFSGGILEHYKVPSSTLQNVGLGGTPNQYQLAQLGFASAYTATNYNDSGYPRTITGTKTSPNGRTTLFDGCDVVVIGMLANGGDYRLSCLEPIIRNLRKAGVEVIVTTDNPQNPTAEYNTLTNTALHVDGPELMRIADLYGVEIADTSAYVVEAHLRAGGVGIFADTIHMSSGAPAGPTIVSPANGHEAWARAVRSMFSVHITTAAPTITSRTWDWATGVDGVVYYTNATVAAVAGQLVITRTTPTSQWGARMPFVSAVKSGDTVVVTGTVWWDTAAWGINKPSVGLQGGGGGWGGTQYIFTSPGPFTATLTASRDANDSWVLLFGNYDLAPTGTEIKFDDVTITVTATGAATVVNKAIARQSEVLSLPPQRIVTDMKTPGDAWIILPADEEYTRQVNAVRGSLEAHPGGVTSFARRFNSSVGATSDLLVLTTGKNAALAACGVVGFAMILYSVTGNAAATYDVYVNGSLNKTITIAAQTLTREVYHTIYTPTEFNQTSPLPTNRVIDIRCTSGTIRIAALVALTSDHEYMPIEAAQRVGNWTGKVGGGNPNMPGYATDTAGDYMVVRAPDDARRLSWLSTGKAVSKPRDTWSGRSTTLAQAGTGTNHVYAYGGHVGPGEFHYIRCAETLVGGGDSVTGQALHIGGIVIVRDR